MVIEKVNTASVSMINGEFALNGMKVMPIGLKQLTTIS